MQNEGKRGNAVVIGVLVPFANMFGYVNQLRSLSRSQASYVMHFDHYAEVPGPFDDPPFSPAIGLRG